MATNPYIAGVPYRIGYLDKTLQHSYCACNYVDFG